MKGTKMLGLVGLLGACSIQLPEKPKVGDVDQRTDLFTTSNMRYRIDFTCTYDTQGTCNENVEIIAVHLIDDFGSSYRAYIKNKAADCDGYENCFDLTPELAISAWETYKAGVKLDRTINKIYFQSKGIEERIEVR